MCFSWPFAALGRFAEVYATSEVEANRAGAYQQSVRSLFVIELGRFVGAKRSLSLETRVEIGRLYDEMASDEMWWIRLYLAQLLRKYPDTASEDLRAKLAKDESELVRITLTRVPPASPD